MLLQQTFEHWKDRVIQYCPTYAFRDKILQICPITQRTELFSLHRCSGGTGNLDFALGHTNYTRAGYLFTKGTRKPFYVNSEMSSKTTKTKRQGQQPESLVSCDVTSMTAQPRSRPFLTPPWYGPLWNMLLLLGIPIFRKTSAN